MSQEHMPPAPVQSARRRLLKGSVCVPSVMTLASGSALAAASSIRCFNNAPNGADPAIASIKGRQRYYPTGAATVTMISRSELQSLATSDGFVIGSWFTVNSNGLPYIKLDGTGYTGAVTTDTGKYVGIRYTYTAGAAPGQRFEATGLTTSTTTNGGSGQVMYGSCWTSCAGLK